MSQVMWLRLVLSQVTLFIILIGSADQCGTGRGGWRRRSSRKMTPLVYRQYIPNVLENTLGASGLAEGIITKKDEKYKDLVVNLNPDIVFKDEENTSEDRVMTQRCKDKLNTLAISVENTWPGIKLRVTEGWDQQGHHAKDSLHYEGRAVDVTTSDKDRSKYGMLARLAVEAGFDYVFYESRGHIHASVKSDSSIASNYGGCFTSNDTVELIDGNTKLMSQLNEGDVVLSMTSGGHLVYSPVILFFHKNDDDSADFVVINTENGYSLSLTPNHLIYYSSTNNTQDLSTAVFAKHLRRGHYIYVKDLYNGRHTKAERVISVLQKRSKGFYAPLTKHGTIVVNNVISSCYAHINQHSIAHLCLAPMRWLHSLTTLFPSQHLNKLLKTNVGHSLTPHWYAELLHSLAPYVIPSSLLYTA